jgi:hypothetical protein
VTVLVLTAAMVVAAGPAWASDDLGPYLEEQAAAEFSGEQTVVCYTPDGLVSELTFVRQADGVRVVEDAEGAFGITRVSHGEDWTLGDQYSIEVSGRDRFLSRPVTVVEVVEGSLVRVVLFFDHASGALLASDVHNSDGSTYCSSRFLSFDPKQPSIADELLDGLTTVPGTGAGGQVDAAAFPEEIAGFMLTDVSAGPAEGVTNGYYADGVFSFTLFVSDRIIEVPELDDAPVVDFRAGEYQRRFYPGQVIFAWQTKSGGIVLVGDLPLDLQHDVLEELPAPGKPNFFVRFWRGLFG